MSELIKISNDDSERIKREYVRLHINTQREYLEHRIRNGNDLARLFCSAAITNLNVSQSALEQAVNGIQIELIPDEESIATREGIDIQRLMDANSLMTRFTFQIMAHEMLRGIKPEDAYKDAIIGFLKYIKSVDELRERITRFYKRTSPQVQITAAIAIDFLYFLEEKFLDRKATPYITAPQRLLE